MSHVSELNRGGRRIDPRSGTWSAIETLLESHGLSKGRNTYTITTNVWVRMRDSVRHLPLRALHAKRAVPRERRYKLADTKGDST